MRTLSEHTCLCKSDSDRTPDRQSAITACRVPAPTLISNASNANGAQRNARPVNARALRHCLPRTHGLASSLYTNRGSHYFTTPEAGGKVDKVHITQVGGALAYLGIEHIAAYSPEARGRSERMFGTLQDRLVKELALANGWIRDVYLPEHKRLPAKPPAVADSAFVAVARETLVEALAIEHERVVARDNTVSWEGHRLQIPASAVRHHYVKAHVKVRQYPDGRLAIFYGPRVIARFDANGQSEVAARTAPEGSKIPAAASVTACSTASRSSLAAAQRAEEAERRPSLTRPARAVTGLPSRKGSG